MDVREKRGSNGSVKAPDAALPQGTADEPAVAAPGTHTKISRPVADLIYSLHGDHHFEPRESVKEDFFWGGVCAIIAGVLAIGQGIAELSGFSHLATHQDAIWLYGVWDIPLGFLSILGGYVAFGHRRFTIAVSGAACGIIGFGFGAGAVLGVIATALIAMSRSDFP